MSVSIRRAPPYLRRPVSTAPLMWDVCVALIPSCLAAVYFFGMPAVWILVTAVAVSLACGWLYTLRQKHAPFDISPVVTGLILALSCPSGTPLWLIAVGCVFAIVVAKEAFGGIGCNLFNPAMLSRAVLLVTFPAFVSGYALPDATSSATPLADIAAPLTLPRLFSLISGRVGGSLGETSALMLLLGFLYLCIRRVIRPTVPLLSLAAFSVTVALCGQPILPHLLSGSILFGAVYIFTDYTTKPATPWGEILFAVCAGTFTALFRLYGRYPEGVCFAVLCANLLAPLIETITAPHVFGTRRMHHEHHR